MTEHHLRLDAQGYPHIAYGGEHLYYAWQTAEGWHFRTVDDTPIAGKAASLALDSAGYAHIGYEDRAGIKYAYQDGGGWYTETVTSSVGSSFPFGPDLDLVVGPGGEPHIGYCANRPDYELRHAYRDAAGWHSETVDSGLGEYGWDVSMAIDASGFVHIAYYDGANEAFRYAYQTDTGWHFTHAHRTGSIGAIAGSASVVCGTPNLVLDGYGFAHIAYPVYDPYAQWSYLWYSYEDLAGWHGEIVDWSGVCADVSLAVDASGTPHISFQESLAVDLQYAYRNAEGWHIETVDSEGRTGYSNSIAVDQSGGIHISYYDFDHEDLRYTYLDAGNWHFQTLDDGSHIALDNSLVLDGSDNPHVSYYEETSGGGIQYAHLGATGWTTEIVDGGTYNQRAPLSLALDSASHPHLSYQSPALGGGLTYAYRDGDGWHTEEIDNAWLAGSGNSLALDGDDYPHISYASSQSNPSLNYVFQDADGWHTTIVDFEGTDPTSLVLDSAGHPHISYKADWGLRYAHHDGSDWQLQAVDSGQQVGGGNSLVLDGNGNPHITYCDEGSPAVKYAYRTASGWQVLTIESGLAEHTSLVLDGNGNPHVSYGLDGMLTYAYRDTGGWHITAVDDDGGSPSLAFDRDGQPHILYGGTGPRYDLRYAYRIMWEYTICLPLIARGADIH
jgi:hypothetical protein